MKSLYSNAFARIAAIASMSSMVFGAPAFAQNPSAATATCDIDNARPQAVARATFSMARAQAALKAGTPAKDLRDVISVLNTPSAKNENPIGRAYLLGQAYMLLLEQPGIAPIATRSSIGLTTDPAGTIDLFAAADSMWNVVEASSPACVSVGRQWRQQKTWLNITNAAINALNAGKLDSAEYFANRALLLDRNAPYAYSVLASVAKTRKNYPVAGEYWKKTLAAAGTDTAFNDVREHALYDMAATTTIRTDATTGAEKKALAREAINNWNVLLGKSTDDIQNTFAVQNLAKLYVVAGDSLSTGKIYAPMLAEPGRYGENTLMQAGVLASQFKHPDDAARLFLAVLERNPYQRDALNDLAASYIFLNQYDKVFPLVERLTAVDPSNPENWMLNAYSYAGLLKNTKPGKLNKQYTDSLVFYNAKAEKMPVKVTITEFSRSSDSTIIVGMIENRSTAAKTFPLTVDFLDNKGQVLFSETALVGPVTVRGMKEFRIKSAKGGVSAFRYKPLT